MIATLVIYFLIALAAGVFGYGIGVLAGETRAYNRYVYEENRSPHR